MVAKKPKTIHHDLKESFMEIKNTNKIAPLQFPWSLLDPKSCWASSRYEFAFTL